jgi:hypothetical protein
LGGSLVTPDQVVEFTLQPTTVNFRISPPLRAALTLAGIYTITVGAAAGAQSPRVFEIADSPSCPRCTIQITHAATLGEPAEQAILDGVTRSLVHLPKGGYLALTYGSGRLPLRFAEDGKYLGVLGRKGAGPGEFGDPIHLRVTAGDTIRIVDAAPSRVSVYTPDLDFVRTDPFDPVSPPVADVLFPPTGGVVVSAPGAGSDGLPRLLHYRKDSASSGAEFDKPKLFRAAQPNLQRRQIAGGADATVWSLHGLEYVLDRWTLDGRLVEQLSRKAPWFPPATGVVAPSAATPPHPIGMRIHSDDQGLLWVFILVPDSSWADALVPRKSAAGKTSYRIDDPNGYYDTMIEVIDPVAHRVVARRRVDQAMALASSAKMTESDRETMDLYPLIDVWKISLVRP